MYSPVVNKNYKVWLLPNYIIHIYTYILYYTYIYIHIILYIYIYILYFTLPMQCKLISDMTTRIPESQHSLYPVLSQINPKQRLLWRGGGYSHQYGKSPWWVLGSILLVSSQFYRLRSEKSLTTTVIWLALKSWSANLTNILGLKNYSKGQQPPNFFGGLPKKYSEFQKWFLKNGK